MGWHLQVNLYRTFIWGSIGKVDRLILTRVEKLSLLPGAVFACLPAVFIGEALQRGVRQKRWNLKLTRQPISRLSMLREGLLNSVFASSISLTSFLSVFSLPCRLYVCPPSFSLFCLFCLRLIPSRSWYNYICVHKRVCVSVFFACLGFYITKSLLKNEGKVCIHAWAYSKCTETFHLPQRPACLQGCALPSLPLLST